MSLVSSFNERLKLLPTGKKNIDQLNELLELMTDIYKQIRLREGSNGFTLEYVTNLKEKIDRYKQIIKKNRSLFGTDSTELKFTEGIEGFSVSSLQNNYLPRLVEVMMSEVFNDGIFNLTGELVSGNTQKGTSADLKVGEGYFSIKTNKPRQTKSKILETFNNWNDSLNQPVSVSIDGTKQDVAINYVHDLLVQKDFYKMSEYLIYNYVYLGASGSGLLDSAFELLALSSLYEKMFGYNKSKQDQTLEQLVQEMPIATLDASGNVYFMDKMIVRIQRDIVGKLGSLSNINNYMKYDLESGYQPQGNVSRKQTTPLWTHKRAMMKKLKRRKEPLTYKSLKSMVDGEINTILASLEKSIKLTIAYNFGKAVKDN